MREEVGGFVYILASARNGTLYTGSTRDLLARMYEHREGVFHGFTRKHSVTRLVWFETREAVAAAYTRERSIKRWHRDWRLALIEKANPQWRDLYDEITSNLLPVTFLNTASRTQPRP
ncbi:MAG: GIY-YIG nuclease family protein [Caulobacteraceae bacterium]|nr:GIY-YIG nuclease family protein [Caulobacteraceae bacterium]